MMISLTLTFALLLLLSLTLTHAIKTGVDELRCRCEVGFGGGFDFWIFFFSVSTISDESVAAVDQCEDDDLSPHNPSIDGTECNEAAEQACATTCAGDDGCGSNKLLSSKCLGTETVCDLAAGVSLTASLDCIKELNPACALPQNFIGPDVNQTLLCECHANGHQCTAKSPCTVGTAEEADCLVRFHYLFTFTNVNVNVTKKNNIFCCNGFFFFSKFNKIV